jgi:pyridoxal phosphate-dependent aminotransferase EpsN
MSEPRIHLSVPHMSGEEQEFVAEAFRTNWLSTVGPNVDAFEEEMAARLGQGTQALAVSSGTAALHLILRELGIVAGDRVAVSTLTFAGSVYPILYMGAVPVFLDSEEQSWNVDPALVEDYLRDAARRNQLPRALIAVHLYGQHADIARIAAACEVHGVALIEDAAESLGSTYYGRDTATTARYSLLSFNGNKIITTSGGGMVIAKDPDAISRMRKWANQSREPAVEYLHREVGYNYRMSNVLAGIGRGQLRVLEDRVRARRRVAQRYSEAFEQQPGGSLQPEARWGRHTRWLTVAVLDPAECPVRPAELISQLDERNIEARPVWRPMHTQPLFAEAPRVGGKVAERLYEEGVCLPSSSSLSEEEQSRVLHALTSAMQPATLTRSR